MSALFRTAPIKIVCVIFIAIVALVNVAAGLLQAWRLHRKKIARCTGVIVASRVASETGNARGKPIRMYWPEVECGYSVGGHSLRCSRISFAFVKTSVEKEVHRKLAAFPQGRTVDVFYNPDDPADSYLKNPKFHMWTSLLIAFGMALFGITLGSFFWWALSQRSERM